MTIRCDNCASEIEGLSAFIGHLEEVHGQEPRLWGVTVNASFGSVSERLDEAAARATVLRGRLSELGRNLQPFRELVAQMESRELFPPIPGAVHDPYLECLEPDLSAAARIDAYDLAAERRLLEDVDSMSARLEDPGPGQDAETYVHPEPYAAVKGWYWVRCTHDFQAMNDVDCREEDRKPWATRAVRGRVASLSFDHDHLAAFTGDGELLEMIDANRYAATRTEEGIQE